ncbi:hypothetical protein E9993_12565 [Labilibacter sediminis]|nr:hypothetical protein E9993_12565 [Labilibacter sediminis]
MKKYTLLLLVIIMALPVMAQKKSNYEKTAEKVVSTWVEVCDLSQEQSNALLPVMVEKQKELSEVRKKYEGKAATIQSANREIGKKYHKKIVAVVGSENVQKMNEYWKAQQNK